MIYMSQRKIKKIDSKNFSFCVHFLAPTFQIAILNFISFIALS